MKKIITLSMIKNEADIVETFVRYTMNYASKMVFIDNGCTDGSIEILKALIAEGFNIDIYNESQVFYEQYLIENKYIRKLAETEEFDYLIPLDVDEFLASAGDLEKRVNELPTDKVTVIKWKTYCMLDFAEKDFFMDRITHVRCNEKNPFTKVIIPHDMIGSKGIYVTMGHHDVEGNSEIAKAYNEYVCIAHFPVRSETQIRLKIYQGILSQLMSSYHSIVAFHWKKMFNELRANKFNIVEYSCNYALRDNENFEEIAYISEPFDYSWCKKSVLPIYQELQKSDVLDNIYQLAEVICIKSILQENTKEHNKEKILVYGTGGTAKNLFRFIDETLYEIVAYVDSDSTLEYGSFMGKLIISPDKIKFMEYSRIVIASNYYEEIYEILSELGISKEKIISRFDLLEEQISKR